MRNHARLCLLTVALLALAACSSGESSQPETTSSTAPTTTTSTETTTSTKPLVSTTTTTVETTSTTSTVTTTTSAPTSTTTTTQVTTTTAAPSNRQLTITIAGFQFSGDTTGRVGDTVRVVNNDVVSHTWTANNGTFDSGLIGAGQAFSYTFDQPGTYNFFCVPHPGMVGSITITS